MFDQSAREDQDGIVTVETATLPARPEQEPFKRSRFLQVRACAYVARTWHTKLYPAYAGRRQPAFVVQHPRAFRRAYVELWMQPAIELVERDGACQIMLGDHVYATVDANGGFVPGEGGSTITTNPKIAKELASRLLRKRLQQLMKVYKERTGQAIDQEHHECLVFGFTQHAILTRTVMKVMKQAAQRLNPDALRLYRSMGSSSGALLSRIANPNATIALRWQQALQSYPLLTMRVLYDITAHAGAPGFKADKHEREFRRVIVRGLPLVPYFAAYFVIPEAAIRRYQGIHPRRVAQNYGALNEHFDNLKQHCDLPPHLRPRSKSDFIAADRLFQLLDIPARHVPALTKGMKVSLASETRIDRLAGFRDVKRCLARLLRDRREDDALDDILFQGRSLGAMARLNEGWHRAHREATAEADKIRHDMAESLAGQPWQTLTHGPIDLGSLTAIELTTREALIEEGARLGHCVGGYANASFAGYYRIVSLRDAAGSSVSTISLRQKEDGSLRLYEHSAVRNAPPPPEAIAAAKRLMIRLRSEKFASRAPWPRLRTPDDAMDEADALVNQRMREFWIRELPNLPVILAEPSRDPCAVATRRRRRRR